MEALSVIYTGEGYWVNALQPMALPAQSGMGFNWDGFNFSALPSGFNLIAHADSLTPSQFNDDVNLTPPGIGEVPTGNFLTLWMWDAIQTKWYFYSPLLESSGGPAAVCAYAHAHFYLCFDEENKTLGPSVGFWVNRP